MLSVQSCSHPLSLARRRRSPSTPLPPYQRQRPKRCAILIDRHVHKNGGSTIRDLLLEQERLGHALYQGYTQLYWRSIYQKLKKVVSEVRGQ